MEKVDFGGKLDQTKHKETLGMDNIYADVLTSVGRIIRIRTIRRSNLEILGEVELNLNRPVTNGDILVVKAFFAQGQAHQQRKIAHLMEVATTFTKPVIVSGAGAGPDPELKETE